MGRKSKYETLVEPHLDLIESWRLSGDNEIIIASKLGIGYTTLKEYKVKYPAFAAVMRKSKEKLIAKVKRSLIKEALGYEYEETTECIEGILDENGNFTGKRKVKRTKHKKYARPSTASQHFILCNMTNGEFKRLDKEVEEILKETNEEKNKFKFKNEVLKKAFDELYNHNKKIKENENGSKKE